MKNIILIFSLLIFTQQSFAVTPNDGGSGGKVAGHDGGGGSRDVGHDGGSGSKDVGHDGGSGSQDVGNDGGNGIVKREFALMSIALINTIRIHQVQSSLLQWRISPSHFEMVVRSSQVSVTKNLPSPLESTALNGRPLLIISEDKWNEQSNYRKLQILLLTYMNILGHKVNNVQTLNEYNDIVNDAHRQLKFMNNSGTKI